MRMVTTEVGERLARGRERFEDWRRRREGRRIPDGLWLEAVELARRCGIHRTAQALRLNEQSLRRRVRGAEAGPGRGFVELRPERLLGLGGWVVELENGRGARLRVEAPEGEVLDLAGLTRSFLGGERCSR
jgi:hypothetical protein